MNAFWNVVRAEVFKVRRKRRTYVVAGLWWLLLPITVLVVARVLVANLGGSFANDQGGVDAIVQQIASPYGIARLALVGPGYLSPTFYVIVVALLTALLIGEERGYAMWKTVLVAQPSRWAVLFGKITVAMAALAIYMGGALLAGVAFGWIGTLFLPTDGAAGAWGELIGFYALQWAHLAALVAFAFLMVHVARNVALGLVLVFFLPALLEGVYTVYAAVVGFQPVNRFNVFLQTIRMRQVLEDLPKYFFTNNLYAPSRAPVGDLVASFSGGPEVQDFRTLLGIGITLEHAAWVAAGYAVLFTAWLTWRFLRVDVD